MIRMAATCPYCGAYHNPLVHPSFRNESDDRCSDERTSDRGTIAYTWLCETCGETYRLDVTTGSD